MKKLRKIIFWCHLPVGATAGVVILIMCVTGVLLSYEKQITSWADTRSYRAAPPAPETQHLPVETLITKARESRDAAPTGAETRSACFGSCNKQRGPLGTILNLHTWATVAIDSALCTHW